MHPSHLLRCRVLYTAEAPYKQQRSTIQARYLYCAGGIPLAESSRAALSKRGGEQAVQRGQEGTIAVSKLKPRLWPTLGVLLLAAFLAIFGLVGWQYWQDYQETQKFVKLLLEEWERLNPRLDQLEQRVDNWERLAAVIDAHKPDVPAQALAGQAVANSKR